MKCEKHNIEYTKKYGWKDRYCPECERELIEKREKEQEEYERKNGKMKYKTTIMKEFDITKNQIEEAIRKKILTKIEEIANPYYKSMSSILLNDKEVKEKLNEIKKLPKFSNEEYERKKLYQIRKKARDEIEFYCEECDEFIRALPGSQAFESYFHGEIPKEKAIGLLKKAHIRHVHTDYDAIREEEYEKNRKIGLSWEEAHHEAKIKARQEINI